MHEAAIGWRLMYTSVSHTGRFLGHVNLRYISGSAAEHKLAISPALLGCSSHSSCQPAVATAVCGVASSAKAGAGVRHGVWGPFAAETDGVSSSPSFFCKQTLALLIAMLLCITGKDLTPPLTRTLDGMPGMRARSAAVHLSAATQAEAAWQQDARKWLPHQLLASPAMGDRTRCKG